MGEEGGSFSQTLGLRFKVGSAPAPIPRILRELYTLERGCVEAVKEIEAALSMHLPHPSPPGVAGIRRILAFTRGFVHGQSVPKPASPAFRLPRTLQGRRCQCRDCALKLLARALTLRRISRLIFSARGALN